MDNADLTARVNVVISPMVGTISQSCANAATTYITLGTATAYCVWLIVYRAKYSTTKYEGGSCVVLSDGTSAQVVGWVRGELGAGYPLNEDTGLDADIDSGNVRLAVTTINNGGAVAFRATKVQVAV